MASVLAQETKSSVCGERREKANSAPMPATSREHSAANTLPARRSESRPASASLIDGCALCRSCGGLACGAGEENGCSSSIRVVSVCLHTCAELCDSSFLAGNSTCACQSVNDRAVGWWQVTSHLDRKIRPSAL